MDHDTAVLLPYPSSDKLPALSSVIFLALKGEITRSLSPCPFVLKRKYRKITGGGGCFRTLYKMKFLKIDYNFKTPLEYGEYFLLIGKEEWEICMFACTMKRR